MRLARVAFTVKVHTLRVQATGGPGPSRTMGRVHEVPQRSAPQRLLRLHHPVGLFASNTLDRSRTAASRELSGARPNRCAMVARIEVVSCWVWSSTKSTRRNGEITSAGSRVPG